MWRRLLLRMFDGQPPGHRLVPTDYAPAMRALYGKGAVPQHGQTATLGSAPARLLRLLRARLVALAARHSQVRGRPTGRPATASGARASPLHSRRFHRL
eukprot:scaffold13668_cov72-Phaeocystis_antarctica.AAC.3